jgi:hypothetical protein
MGPVTWGIVHGVAGAASKGRYHRLVDTYRLVDIAWQAVSLVRADLLYRFLLLGATLSNRGAPVSCGSHATCGHPVHLPRPALPLVFHWCRQAPVVSCGAGAIARKLCVVVV